MALSQMWKRTSRASTPIARLVCSPSAPTPALSFASVGAPVGPSSSPSGGCLSSSASPAAPCGCRISPAVAPSGPSAAAGAAGAFRRPLLARGVSRASFSSSFPSFRARSFSSSAAEAASPASPSSEDAESQDAEQEPTPVPVTDLSLGDWRQQTHESLVSKFLDWVPSEDPEYVIEFFDGTTATRAEYAQALETHDALVRERGWYLQDLLWLPQLQFEVSADAPLRVTPLLWLQDEFPASQPSYYSVVAMVAPWLEGDAHAAVPRAFGVQTFRGEQDAFGKGVVEVPPVDRWYWIDDEVTRAKNPVAHAPSSDWKPVLRPIASLK